MSARRTAVQLEEVLPQKPVQERGQECRQGCGQECEQECEQQVGLAH